MDTPQPDTTQAAARVWHTGIPYRPDVERLLAAFPQTNPGDVITYEQIEYLLGKRWNTSRTRGVVEAWRRRLERERHVCLQCEDTKQFRVCDATGRMRCSDGHWRKARNQVVKSIGVALRTDPLQLDAAGRMARDHRLATGATVRYAIACAAKAKAKE